MRSISTPEEAAVAASEEANAAIKSGGNSFVDIGRADFGASVTGEAKPPAEVSDMRSSGFMRREERSSLCGKLGR